MSAKKITSSSTAEYFAKNLQQVGFSSPLKAVLTTLKEAVDNSLDACEEEGLLPEVKVSILKIGAGSAKATDLVEIIVEDNGPGIDPDNIAQVFGEYLASSKFGRGQCSRGQQGIGISAATTWAQLTNARGVTVTTKTKGMRKAVMANVDVDIKANKGILRNRDTVEWDRPHGTRVEFRIDGRIQLNGDGGLLTYLEGTTLVNPHLTLHYKLPDQGWVKVERVSQVVPEIPASTLPHPHTMKLGEFMTHAHLFGKIDFAKYLKTGFSRVSDVTIKELAAAGLSKKILAMPITQMKEDEYKSAFQIIQKIELQQPSTRSVLTVGEESLSKSILRLGDIDFFSVVTRKPRICDFKPVVVEVALARFLTRGSADESIQLLRFANRVPLQFDKSACAITQAVESVNWRAYGLGQGKDSLPQGPYVFAVSVVSPFIKFKNASKETIDASDELTEEIRRALMQAGQKLSRHIRREHKEADLERKLSHIEQFAPILVEGLVRITGASNARKVKAEEGLKKLLGRDTRDAEKDLSEAELKLQALKERAQKAGVTFGSGRHEDESEADEGESGGRDSDTDNTDASDASDESDEAETKSSKGKGRGTQKGTEKTSTEKTSTEKTGTNKAAVAATTTAKKAAPADTKQKSGTAKAGTAKKG